GRVAGQDGYRQSCCHVAEVVRHESELSRQGQGAGIDGAGEKALGRQTGDAGKAVAVGCYGGVVAQMDSDRARAVYTGYINDKARSGQRELLPRWQSGIRLTKASC